MTKMPVIATFTGAQIAPHIPDLSRLRAAVFREWPYLYDGDPATEAAYIEGFADCKDAVLVTATTANGEIVGAATGSAVEAHHDDFGEPVAAAGFDPSTTFYFAESVLLPDWRGHGLGHAFFDAREAHARARSYKRACFCAVVRPEDHPTRPKDARSLDSFWAKRGYRKIEGMVAHHAWRDIGEAEETEKPLQFYMAEL